MPELNHFRIYEIAQTESGEPLELAREGDQVVCLGFDTDRRKFVEIVALAGGDNDEFIERAERAGALQHPSLAGIVETGIEDNVAFYAADLVDGEALEAYAERVKSVPFELAATWLGQIAEGAAALEEEDLAGRVGSARLALAPGGRVAARLVDFGVVRWAAQADDPIGTKLARYLRTLTNYQSAGEEPVYPPEVEPLCAELEGLGVAERCAELFADAGALPQAPPVGESMRPRFLMERLMFRRARPEHVLPPALKPVRRAGELSPYESIVEGDGGRRQRVLVLPPARFVSEHLLDIFEDAPAEGAVGRGAFWKHEDFRLLAEEFRPGFDLAAWTAARPRRPGGEIASLLTEIERAVERLAEGGVRPRGLDPEDVLIEFETVEGDDVDRFLSEVPHSEWPAHVVQIRTHPTMRALAGPADGLIPDGAEEVMEAAAAGRALDAGEVFTWYFNLRNRGLNYQAGELVESIEEAVGGHRDRGEDDLSDLPVVAPIQLGVPDEDEPVLGGEEDGEESEGDVLSPIAAAMGVAPNPLSEESDVTGDVDRDEGTGEDGGDDYTNPIAQSVGVPLGAPEFEEDLEEDEGGLFDEGEFDDDDEPDGESANEEPATPFTQTGLDFGGQREQDGRDVDSMLDRRDDTRPPEPVGRGASILLLFLILALSVAIAAGIAHISGRAFWQQ